MGDFLGIGGEEIFLVVVVILIIFGPHKIPEIARGLGQTVHNFKKASSELTSAVNREIEMEEAQKTSAKAGTPPSTAPDKDDIGPGAGI